MCCTQLAGNTGRKNDAKNRHLRTIVQFCRAISSQLKHVSTTGKNLLSSNISPTCPYNMVNFGQLAAEIVLLVWGTPANFNGFHVLLHGTLLVGGSQIAALTRGRHLYAAKRPSRWALAHISSWTSFSISYGWGDTRQIVSKLAAFRRGESVWDTVSGGRGRPPANILIPFERQLIALQLCCWQFLYNETLQQTFRPLLSKLSKRRQI